MNLLNMIKMLFPLYIIFIFTFEKSNAKQLHLNYTSLCSSEEDYRVIKYQLNQNCQGRTLTLKVPYSKPDKQSLKIFSCLTGSEDLTFRVDLYNTPERTTMGDNTESHHIEAVVDESKVITASHNQSSTVVNSNLGKLKTVLIKVNNNPKCDIHIGKLGTEYPFIYSDGSIEKERSKKFLYFFKFPSSSTHDQPQNN